MSLHALDRPPSLPGDLTFAVPSEAALRKAEWQPVLFASRPLRSRLLTLRAAWPCNPLVIRVHRNHAFELVASAMQPYLAYAGWGGDFRHGDYDDSLSFGGVSAGSSVDAEVVWLDFERYGRRDDPAGLANWLAGRLRSLRTLSPAPILVSGWCGGDLERSFNAALAESLSGLPGVRLGDPGPIADVLALDSTTIAPLP